MQVVGGQSVSTGWRIPGTAHREAPTPPGPAPMTIDTGRPEQQWRQPQPAAPRPDTLAQQIYRGILGVNNHPEDAQALDVFEVMADQLVQRHQAEVDAGKAAYTTAPTPEARIEAQRIWARDQKVLDALATEGQKANAVAEAIRAAKGDPVRVSVYKEEAASYLRAAGIDPGFLENVFAEVIPGQAERIAKLDNTKQLRTTLRHAVQMVRNGAPAVALDKLAPAISRLDPER